MPCRAEDMGAQDAAVGQSLVDIGTGEFPGALRHGPPGGAVILRLHGTEPAHHSRRGGPGRRAVQPLVAQTLANNICRDIHRGSMVEIGSVSAVWLEQSLIRAR